MSAGMRRSLLTRGRGLGLITVKAVATSNGNTINFPSATAAGDLVLLYSSSYNSNPWHDTSKWTHRQTSVGQGTYNVQALVSSCIAGPSDANAMVSISNVQASYTGSVMLVLTGHDAANPINATNEAHSTSWQFNMGTGSVTTTAPTRRFMFWSLMSNTGGGIPAFTLTTSGGGATRQATVPAATPAYHLAEAWSHDVMQGAGTLSEHTIQSNDGGAMTGIVVAVASA